jgi:hypothetical protein
MHAAMKSEQVNGPVDLALSTESSQKVLRNCFAASMGAEAGINWSAEMMV